MAGSESLMAQLHNFSLIVAQYKYCSHFACSFPSLRTLLHFNPFYIFTPTSCRQSFDHQTKSVLALLVHFAQLVNRQRRLSRRRTDDPLPSSAGEKLQHGLDAHNHDGLF